MKRRPAGTPIRLGVNVDHVATVRQARGGEGPDPVEAALQAERAGADSIVCHLREDRRHIQDRDVERLRRRITTPLNMEMGLNPGVVEVALAVRPRQVTLVPEHRRELTTEGGLDVRDQLSKIRSAVARFQDRGIAVSLFIDPDLRQVAAALATGAPIVEIHTGAYAGALAGRRAGQLRRLQAVARAARRAGLQVAAGHGLDYAGVAPVASTPEIEELNIGFAIISRALFAGLPCAVREMKRLMEGARRRAPVVS